MTELSAAAAPPITGEQLFALATGPCELVAGRIVPMAPTGDQHGGVEAALAHALYSFVQAQQLGKVRVGKVGIYTRRNPDSVRSADLLYISNERYAPYAARGAAGYLDVAPDLVVEILSPNDRWSELAQKLTEYFAIGVRLVWVVDPAARAVSAYRTLADVRTFAADADGAGGALPGDDVLPGCVLPVAQLCVG